MDGRSVSPALAERLGPHASSELLDLLDTAEERCMNIAAERAFERLHRHLTDEVAGLRIQMTELRSDVRQNVTSLGSDLRQDMAGLGGQLRQEMAAQRVDLLKWSFLFWIGQVVTLTGIMALLLRHG